VASEAGINNGGNDLKSAVGGADKSGVIRRGAAGNIGQKYGGSCVTLL